MSIEELTRPKRIDEERIQKLKELFPEAFADGKLNLEILQEEINGIDEELIENNTEEFYGLQWVGKKEARRLAFLPPQGTLKLVKGEGVNEDKAKNIIIEGDNLEVLRILQKSYKGKVNFIYIDPPYNTGNDFIYKDDFKDPVASYLQKSGQADEEGLLTSNPKAGGRFHTNWLNMMYPRLRLAKDLLADDGLIFISIDENEVFNLRIMLNEIFGEENFLQELVWQRHAGGGNDSKYFAVDHEYILVCAKNKNSIKKLRVPLSEDEKKEYTGKDEHFDTLGPFKTKDFRRMRPDDPRPGLRYTIIAPDGTELYDEWKWEESKFKEKYAENKIQIRRGKNNNWIVEYKIYLNEEEEGDEREKVPRSLLTDVERNSEGKKQLKLLFGQDNIFNNPKPLGLIKYLLSIGNKNDLVLDFFAGSGTTGQAVLELNEEDGGNRSFILVQVPEKITKKGHPFDNIVEITKERIRKTLEQLKKEDGFKVYRLDRSNIRKWNNYKGNDIEQLERNLDFFTNAYFVDGWTEDDVIIELMLSQGFPLDSIIECEKNVNNNTLWIVKHNEVPFNMYICLDKDLAKSTVSYLVNKHSQDIFICLDEALSNETKVILSETLKVKTI